MKNYMEELRQRLTQSDSPIRTPPPPPRGIVKPPKRNIDFNKYREQPKVNKYPFVEELNGTEDSLTISR